MNSAKRRCWPCPGQHPVDDVLLPDAAATSHVNAVERERGLRIVVPNRLQRRELGKVPHYQLPPLRLRVHAGDVEPVKPSLDKLLGDWHFACVDLERIGDKVANKDWKGHYEG